MLERRWSSCLPQETPRRDSQNCQISERRFLSIQSCFRPYEYDASFINDQAKMNVLFCLLLFVSATFARESRGTCQENTLIDVFNTDSLDQCKVKCREDDNCVALTFNVELKVCQTFSHCIIAIPRKTGRCPNCITVRKEEFIPEVCSFQGICQVRFSKKKK